MLTTVYHLQGTPQTTLSMKELLDFLGGDTPLPSDLQGDESGPLFLLCVDEAVDISEFCGPNGYAVTKAVPFEADNSRYNSKYRIVRISTGDETYALEPAF